MDLLAIQIESPGHVAWAAREAAADATPMDSAMMILYAAHRLLRITCSGCRGFGAERMGRLPDMAGFLLDGSTQEGAGASSGLSQAVLSALRTQTVRDALRDLATTSEALVVPDAAASRTTREWQATAEGLATVLKALLPLASAIRTAAGDGRGGLHVAVGPDGNAFTRTPGNTVNGTVLLLADGSALEEYGPAYMRAGGGAPEPLIRWPSESALWETIDGIAVDADGTNAGPTGPIDGRRAFGRLLAWSGGESWEPAERLARIGSGVAAVEYLLLRTAGSDEWRTPGGIQKLIDFAGEHGEVSQWFRGFALRKGALSETAALDDGDYEAAAGILVVRQQLESGADKARTLRKLANLYLDRLGDRTAAQLCLVKALEAVPGDSGILAVLLDVTGETPQDADDNGLAEVAGKLMSLARELEGRPQEADVLNNAARLFGRIGDHAAADRARVRLLELDADAVGHFEELSARLAGPVEVLDWVERLLPRAWKADSRGRYMLIAAGAQRELGRAADAAASMKEAAALLPETPELLDAMREAMDAAGDWPGLIGTLKRSAETADDPVRRVEASLQIADIALVRMHSPVVALSALAGVAESADPRVLRRMFDIHSELGMWSEAARDMELLCSSTPDPRDLVMLARIYRDRLGRPADSAARFKAALDHLDGRELAEAAVEFAGLPGIAAGEAAAVLKRAAALMDDDLLKAGLLKRLGGRESAAGAGGLASADHLEEALRLNPADHDCAVRLAEIYLAGDLAEKAAAILEPPARAARESGDAPLEARLRMMAAGAATRCFDHAGAARHLKRVLEISPTDQEALRGLARTELALGDVEAAQRRLLSIPGAGGALTPEDARILRELGRAWAGRGNPAAALESLETAWRLDSDMSEDVLRELADTASAAGDHAAMVSWLRRLVRSEAKSPRRFTDLVRLGDALKATGELEGALEWYMAASNEEYSRKVALHKALEVALEAGRMDRATELLSGLIDEEQDAVRKSELHMAAGLLYGDNLRDNHAAIDHLLKALTLNPDNAQAAEALDERLLEAGMFDELIDSLNLRTRHFRMTGDEQRLVGTLHMLGDVYEKRLHDIAKAAEVFAQIVTAAPSDPTALRRLAFCQSRLPGAEGEALVTLRKVVAIDPTSVESYRALRDLGILAHDDDLATRASSALIVLGQGDESDFHLAALNRAAALHLKTDQMPGDVFTRRIAFDLDARVARIFALLYQPILKTMPFRRPADLGLNDGNRIDMGADGLFQKMADAVGHVFNMDLPDFWHAPGTVGMKKAPFASRAVVVGDDLALTRRGKDLRYSLSRAVVSFMPGAELCGVLDAAAMRLFFMAALKMAFPEYPLPPDAAPAADFVPSLAKNLREPEAAEIRRILTGFSKTQKPVDFPEYLRAVDRISGRAGLFMANDLEVAAARSLEGDLTLSDMEPGDRIVELCSWAVSSNYTELKNMMIG